MRAGDSGTRSAMTDYRPVAAQRAVPSRPRFYLLFLYDAGMLPVLSGAFPRLPVNAIVRLCDPLRRRFVKSEKLSKR